MMNEENNEEDSQLNNERENLKAFMNQNFNIEIDIVNQMLVNKVGVTDKNSDKYLVYQLKVRTVGREYLIEKRYSDFESLHKELKKKVKTYGFTNFPSSARLT
jgi:hypothetical protein